MIAPLVSGAFYSRDRGGCFVLYTFTQFILTCNSDDFTDVNSAI